MNNPEDQREQEVQVLTAKPYELRTHMEEKTGCSKLCWLTCAHLHMHTRTHMHTDTQMYFRKEKRVVFSYMTDVGIDPKSEACGKFNTKVETRETWEGEIS